MRQLIFILTALLTAPTFALEANDANRNAVYEDFQKTKDLFLSSTKTKKDFAKKFKKLDADLNAKFLKLKSLEKKQLSVEGNQLALDLELLQPLRNLATSAINKINCRNAETLNQMNLTDEEKDQINLIEKVLKSICN